MDFSKLLESPNPSLLLNAKDFYNAETKVIKMPKRPIDFQRKGEGHHLLETMKKHFGKTALIDLTQRKMDTYDELYTRIIRTAIKMMNLGIKPGDIISICSHNQIHSISVFLSAFLIGAINASLEPSFPDEDVEHLAKQVSPKIFFVSSETEKRIGDVCKKLGLESKIVVFGETELNLRYADFICPQDGEDSFEPYIPENLEDTCVIMFSSGSTGLPKAMCFSHKFFAYHSLNLLPLRNSMSMANIFWTGAIQVVLLQIKSGAIFSFATEFDPVGIWENIKTFEITFMQLPPHIAVELIENKPEDWDGVLPFLAIVGAATSKERILELRRALPKTLVGSLYALTEAPNLFNCMNPTSYIKVLSVGRPVPGIEYKVVDPETEENVGFNQHGELRLKSEYLLKGYHNQDSSNVWDEDGFFKTGDIVYFDEDFDFFIVDRIKEMFKRLGNHVIPIKFEAVLESHPDITMGVLVGIPNGKDSNDIVAVVVPRKGSTITPEEVEKYYNEKVIYYAKLSMGVKFMESLPMTPTGKVARLGLKKMVMNELNKTL